MPGNLKERLLAEPERFDFFQLVRLLERIADEEAKTEPARKRWPVGEDSEPEREVVRFRALQGSSFPASAVASLRLAPAPQAPGRNDGGGAQLEMVVSFLGLTGPAGVLPRHYTRLVLELLRERDRGLADFLDLFNHRLISLFHRAWEKYRFASRYWKTSSGPDGGEQDLFTRVLHSLAGFGTGGLRSRLRVGEDFVLFYSGIFADRHRTQLGLERMLTDYLGVPVRIDAFHGRWLALGLELRSALSAPGGARSGSNVLGSSAILGSRVWDAQSKFRVRVGPLTYDEYCDFTPGGTALCALSQVVRAYVGPELDFDVQVALKAAEVPRCRLATSPEHARRLSWNIWLRRDPFTEDFDGAVFASIED